MFRTICCAPISALALCALAWGTGATDVAAHTHATAWYVLIAAVVFAIPLSLGDDLPFVSAPFVSFLNTVAVLLYVTGFSTMLAIGCAAVAAFVVLWVADLGLGRMNDRGEGNPLGVLIALYTGLAIPALAFWLLVASNDRLAALCGGSAALIGALGIGATTLAPQRKAAASVA
jgi:hypothetical protein